jgi:hypothetical protein
VGRGETERVCVRAHGRTSNCAGEERDSGREREGIEWDIESE